MNRSLALPRAFFAAGILLLLAGVVALSTATRTPFLRVCTGSWHTYKAGHLTESDQKESSTSEAAESAEDVVAEIGASSSTYVPSQETLPNALALALHKHHFRSPPPLQ
ncbi:MAG TPA: hypothetical protein VEO19_07040 [Terriglobia bacterium]|nr:hypothetical protein [Terriglobia bacterium]